MSVTEFTVAGHRWPVRRHRRRRRGLDDARPQPARSRSCRAPHSLPASAFDLGAAGSRPSVIVAGPDDAVWFTRNGDDHLGRIGYDGTVSAVAVAGAPYGLCVGPDGALWCTLMNADRIGRVTVDGEVSTYPIGTTGRVPGDDHRGRRRAVVHAQPGQRDRPDDHERQVTTYPCRPKPPGRSASAPDADAVWFVEILADQAGRITPDGTIEEFPLPAGSKPHAVVATDDGGCWITLWGAAALARLDANGNMSTQYRPRRGFRAPRPGRRHRRIGLGRAGEGFRCSHSTVRVRGFTRRKEDWAPAAGGEWCCDHGGGGSDRRRRGFGMCWRSGGPPSGWCRSCRTTSASCSRRGNWSRRSRSGRG